MDVYFVRHGRTDGNMAHRHQHQNTQLNTFGKTQALMVAKKLRRKKLTYLITSTYVRTVETARIIGNECELIPETCPAFEELHRPTYLIGERLLGRVTMIYMLRWFFGVDTASVYDGETYANFRNRLALARRHLEALPANAKVVVVSHAIFINFFLAHMCQPTRMTLWQAIKRFVCLLLTKNTAMVHISYIDSKSKYRCHWKLIHDQK